MLTDDALADVNAPIATRCASAETEDDAETLKDASLMTLAATSTVDEAALVNAPIAYLTAEIAVVEEAETVTDASDTP
jgi:hypothetical protein